MNKKGEISNAVLTFTLISYSIMITLILSLIGGVSADINQTETNSTLSNTGEITPQTGIIKLPVANFFDNLITGISVLPLWLNLIVFTPIVGLAIFLLISLAWSGS